MVYGYIYKTTNNLNKKIYIGQHKSSSFDSTYYGSGRYLHNAIRKYGIENFTVVLLECCSSKTELNQREQYWIKELNTQDSSIGYNIAPGGEGGDIFTNMSPEDRQAVSKKLSDKNRGKIVLHKGSTKTHIYKEQLEKYLSEGWELGGVTCSAERKQKTSNSLKGKITVTDGQHNKKILPEELSYWEEQGYWRGSVKTQKMIDSYARRTLKKKAEEEQKLAEWYSKPRYCETCGKLMEVYQGSGRFCSKSCSATHSHTEETKQLLRHLNETGVCGNKGKTFSEQTRQRMSASSPKQNQGKQVINNGECCKYVFPEELPQYIEQGWVVGKIFVHVDHPQCWNDGLTKETDSRIEQAVKKREETMLERYGTLDVYKIKAQREEKNDK